MEIAYMAAATCGACFSLGMVFLVDTVLFFRAGIASVSLSVGLEKIENFKCILVFRDRVSLFLCLFGISAIGKKITGEMYHKYPYYSDGLCTTYFFSLIIF